MSKRREETFGSRLKWLRINAGLTQGEVTDRLQKEFGQKIGRSYLSKLETGEGDVTPIGSIVAALAKILETTTDYLLLLTDNPDLPAAAGAPEDHYVAPESDAVARLLDQLPVRRRREVLALVQAMLATQHELETEARDSIEDLRLKLAAANLVLGQEVVDLLQTLYIQAATGTAAPRNTSLPKSDPGRGGGISSSHQRLST